MCTLHKHTVKRENGKNRNNARNQDKIIRSHTNCSFFRNPSQAFIKPKKYIKSIKLKPLHIPVLTNFEQVVRFSLKTNTKVKKSFFFHWKKWWAILFSFKTQLKICIDYSLAKVRTVKHEHRTYIDVHTVAHSLFFRRLHKPNTWK